MSIRDDLLTVVFRRTGKIFSFNITTHKIVAVLVLVLVLNALLVLFVFQNISLRDKNTSLNEEVTGMKTELEQLRDESKEAMYYKKWADKIICRRLYNGSLSGQGSGSYSAEMPKNPVTIKPETTVIDNAEVAIDDFLVKSLNLELDFDLSFNLVNRGNEHRRISGHVVIAGINEDIVPPVYGVYPPMELVNGEPVDYRDGLDFAIRYMKPVKVRINQPGIGSKFNSVVITVYSSEGNLMLKHKFNIERMLIPDLNA